MKQYIRNQSPPFFMGLHVAACLACLGCGSGVDIALVHGIVQHEGKLLSGGKVLFSSLDGHKPVAGQIESEGTFVLTTLSAGEGATPGRYRVSVISELVYRGKKVKVNCIAPKDFFLTVEASQENDFVINVSAADGWHLAVDD